jgi:subtilisin family serine protease
MLTLKRNKTISFLVLFLFMGITLTVPVGGEVEYIGKITGTKVMYQPRSGNTNLAWDIDGNRISDLLEKELSISENSNAILIFNRDITNNDKTVIKKNALEIRSYMPDLDMIEVAGVTDRNVKWLSHLEGVESVWHRGNTLLNGDVQTPNVKARESVEYSPNTAWELGYQGKGVNIAIMDTGIDNNHPSLSGKWVGGADMSKPESFLTPRDGSFDADDPQGHGTTCSGIATGTGAPEGKYMGAAPAAKLVDLRIGTVVGYAPGEVFQDFYDASLQGAQWALEHKDDAWDGVDEDNHGIDIVSLSWGVDVGYPSPGTDPYSISLNKLVDAGVHVVAAAGNEGPDNNGFHGMGAADKIITVGATDDGNTINRTDDIIAYYSSRGPRTDDGDDYGTDELKPDLSASGTGIIQCQFSSNPLDDASGNGYGNRGSGTSYACPSVVGVVALMLEANPELEPALTKEILRATAERTGEASAPDIDPFWNRDFGWGIVDAYRAVKMAAELENLNSLDVELQCFITNFTVKGDVNIVSGVAWSRTGAKVESVTISGWGDTLTHDISEESSGNFVNWSFEFTSPEEIEARIVAFATGGGKQSLPSGIEETIVREKAGDIGFGLGSTALIITAVVLVFAFCGIGTYYYKRRRKERREN